MSLWLLIMDPSSIRFSKVLEKRCRYSVCRGTQPRAEYFIHTNYRVCSWHLYHVNNSTLWHNDATPAEKLGDLLGKNFPILAKQRTDELKYFFTLLYKIEILLLLSYACLSHRYYCFVALVVDTYILLTFDQCDKFWKYVYIFN